MNTYFLPKTLLLVLSVLSCAFTLSAHQGSIRGLIQDATTNEPLVGAAVIMEDSSRQAFTDELGYYQFDGLKAGNYKLNVQYLGYELQTIDVRVTDDATTTVRTQLARTSVDLKAVTVSPRPELNRNTISQLDIQLRPTNTSQDILKLVPGLFIAQHAGGGKAEQIFLRGFDIDHGTDVALNVDGIPVNMVSHAHGQGYADLHFLIPETVQMVDFGKGPYDARQGNLATAGYVGFQTKNALEKSSMTLEAGSFDTYRAVGLFDLLGTEGKNQNHNAYLATEYMYSDGYFDSPQAYNRYSGMFKYSGILNEDNRLTAMVSSFSSRWDASGQIPERAVEQGLIGRFGAIDDTEGGSTSRTNASVKLTSVLDDGSWTSNQFYLSRYDFELFSNFTFFLNNPEAGDQIRQREKRTMFGYNGAYHRRDQWLGAEWNTEVGLHFRRDKVEDVELSRTQNREMVLERLALGDIDELNVGLYVNENIRFSPSFSLNAGLRFDQFNFLYMDALQGNERKLADANIVSPKLSAFYTVNDKLQLFASSGYGFHSNDTRVVVERAGEDILPRALGLETGLTVKPLPRMLLSASLWSLDLEQEFVYVGDEAVVEPSGETRREGVDLSVRYQLSSTLFADADVNYTFARAQDAPENEDFIPLAAEWTSIGGLSWQPDNGWNASLRYRYLGDRPANEDNSVIADGYFLMDAVLQYGTDRFTLGLEAQNLLNQEWKEAQFDTESRLFNEASPVSEIHYTPGAPRSVRLRLTYFL